MSVIVHFLAYSRFEIGYINFMKLKMPEYEHHFFIKNPDPVKQKYKLTFVDDKNVHYYGSRVKVFFQNMRLLYKCDKIIISGLHLITENELLLLLSGLVSKTYVQFWNMGLDHYQHFFNLRRPRKTMHKVMLRFTMRRLGGTINLIQGDRDILLQAIDMDKSKTFVAPMPNDPLKHFDFYSIRENAPVSSVHKILIGHSSFRTEDHIPAFHALEHLKNENIQIICPLSYGDLKYREKILEAGKNIFGDKFVPILDYMDKEDYIKFLAQCDAGVYFTQTQQGMGNISLLLSLGRKVYMHPQSTAMWSRYKDELNYIFYPTTDLNNITIEELVNFPEEYAQYNMKKAKEIREGNAEKELWEKVFEN